MKSERERGDSNDDTDEMDCSHRLFAGAGITASESVRVFWIGIFRSTGTASRVSISGPLFWGGLLVLGTILVAASFFSRAHHWEWTDPFFTLKAAPPKSYFMLLHDRDTIRDAMRLGRGVRAAQRRGRVTVTADRHDFSIGHVNMFGEGNRAEDCVNIYDGDAVLAIDNNADYVDALQCGAA